MSGTPATACTAGHRLCAHHRTRVISTHACVWPVPLRIQQSTPRLKVSDKTEVSFSGCTIRGGLDASSEAEVSASECTLDCDGEYGIRAVEATIEVTTSAITANALSGCAVSLRRATANISESRLTAATGVHTSSNSRLQLWQSQVHAREYAVLARNSYVRIFNDCSLIAAEHAAVAALEGSLLVVRDSELRCSGRAVVLAACSVAVATHNTMHAPAGPRSAAFVLNCIEFGSAINSNQVLGAAAHIVKFVYPDRHDAEAMAREGGPLTHRHLDECDVPRERCAAYGFEALREEDPDMQGEALWLRTLSVRENPFISNCMRVFVLAGEVVQIAGCHAARAVKEWLQRLWHAFRDCVEGMASCVEEHHAWLRAAFARACAVEVCAACSLHLHACTIVQRATQPRCAEVAVRLWPNGTCEEPWSAARDVEAAGALPTACEEPRLCECFASARCACGQWPHLPR